MLYGARKPANVVDVLLAERRRDKRRNDLSGCSTVTAAIATALDKIGVMQPTWKTLIVSAAQEAELPAAVLWETWARLGDWPLWSTPLHLATRWISEPGWMPGSIFEQTLSLGFPLGKTTSVETVGAVIPGKRVMWWKDEKGIRSCHIWEFDALNADRTRVANVEVFHGMPIGLVKGLVAKKWHRLFEQSVAGLTQQAHGKA